MLTLFLVIGSELEFTNGFDKVVTETNSLVRITFFLNVQKCPTSAYYTITISRYTDGSHLDICKIRLKKTCMVSSSSAKCFCLSSEGPVLFSQRMTINDNNSVYIFKWTDILVGEQQKKVIFQIYGKYCGQYICQMIV